MGIILITFLHHYYRWFILTVARPPILVAASESFPMFGISNEQWPTRGTGPTRTTVVVEIQSWRDWRILDSLSWWYLGFWALLGRWHTPCVKGEPNIAMFSMRLKCLQTQDVTGTNGLWPQVRHQGIHALGGELIGTHLPTQIPIDGKGKWGRNLLLRLQFRDGGGEQSLYYQTIQ